MNNETKAPKRAVNKKILKIGSVSVTTTAVVIAIFIVVNLLVGELPSTATKFDLSARELFTISEETETVLARVNEDVHFYLLTQRGNENPTIREMLERYHALNPRVTWSTVDPVTNPAFIEKYTTETLSDNSVIAESAKRSYVVDYYEIFQTEYTEEDYYNYYYYGQVPQGTPYYYGELQFTTAVDYVTRDDLPVLGVLEGHGETALSENYASLIGDENVEIRTLTLLNTDAVPADVTSILLNVPTADISASEEEMLASYLDAGGSVILVTGAVHWSEAAMPNLAALAAKMGMESVDGLVVETDRNRYMMVPHYLLPVLGSTDTEPLSLLANPNVYVLANAAHGIVSNGQASVRPLLSSTAGAFVKTDLTTNDFAKTDADIEGLVYVGAASQTEAGGRFVWFSTPGITDDAANSYVSGGNSAVFLSVIDWMNGNKTNFAILGKLMQVEALTLTEADSAVWSAVVAIVIPVAVLTVGFVIWFRRRRK